MSNNQKMYNVTKAMSDSLFADPAKLKKALRASIKSSRREKAIRRELNKLVSK